MHAHAAKNPLSLLKAMLHEAIFLATCLATLRKVEGRSTFLATCNTTNVALQVARKIASRNMALSKTFVYSLQFFNCQQLLSDKLEVRSGKASIQERYRISQGKLQTHNCFCHF